MKSLFWVNFNLNGIIDRKTENLFYEQQNSILFFYTNIYYFWNISKIKTKYMIINIDDYKQQQQEQQK